MGLKIGQGKEKAMTGTSRSGWCALETAPIRAIAATIGLRNVWANTIECLLVPKHVGRMGQGNVQTVSFAFCVGG